MLRFIFNNKRSEILARNTRRNIGSNKSYAINSHSSSQYNFDRRTMNSLGGPLCQSCVSVNCPSWWEPNTTSSNGCQFQCLTTTPGLYFYCSGIL